MNACDIIFKTKRKQPLSANEMKWLINGYVSGEVPDYQVSAWLNGRMLKRSFLRRKQKTLLLL